MLKVVLGADRAALSRKSVQCAVDAAFVGEEWILIVPEQFSFEAEYRLCQAGGDQISRYAEVLSFSRLSDRVAAKVGGAAGEYLDKGGQLLTMALAAEQVVSRIKYYSSVLRKPEFLTDMVGMIGEFRSYCLEPKALLDAAKKEQGQFASKLEELGLLYEAYLAVCANTKADPSDKLLRLLNSLQDCDWISSKRFLIDGFSDFTGAELKIIELLVRNAPEVRVYIPCGMQESVMDRAAQKTCRELVAAAKKQGLSCEIERLEDLSSRTQDVQLLLEHMFSYKQESEQESENVSFVMSATVEEECRSAALHIKRLLCDGVRYRDISVACTDMKLYEVPLRNVFRTACISAYFAGERGLLTKPIVAAVVNSLFAAAGAMEYDEVALYLKSGLPGLERERCDKLDNYGYLWNLRGSKWEAAWTMHPRGFGEVWEEEDRTYLEQLNEDKQIALAPLLALRKALKEASNTGEMVLALHGFLEDIRLRERLEEKANAYMRDGAGQAAQELMQIYEILINSLEQTWLTLGETERTPDNFCRLYHTVLTQYQVATIPAGLDQVHVSDLPDLRNKQTQHLIVLGAADGKFPPYKTAEGLLTEDERRQLAARGISVAPGRADMMDQELSKIFFALSAVQKSICISYSGEQPAWLLRRAISLYPKALTVSEDGVLNEREFAALRLRCADTSPCEMEKVKQVQAQLQNLREYAFTPLEDRTVHGLYGSPISLSPSKIDKYASCRFSFFMNYGLRAKPRKQAKLDQPAFGTFVHAVLEHTVLRVMEAGGFHKIEKEEILEIALQEIARYAQEYFPEQCKREEYLFARSKNEIRDIVLDLWEELRRSKFEPAFCELKFMGGQDLPAVKVNGEQAQCRVIGMVDRVDLFRDNGKTYVRVVDYKTGTKDFDYTDILNGAGLQMLIYLFALQTCGEGLLGTDQIEPAGVLYLPAKRIYPLTESMPEDAVVEAEHRAGRRRKGLIRADDNLLAAMEEDPENPQYMPYKNGRKGISGDLASAHQMKLLERHVTRTIAAMADQILDGSVSPNPVVRGQYGSCLYCDYKTVCHKDLNTQERRILAETSAAKFWEQLEKGDGAHG